METLGRIQKDVCRWTYDEFVREAQGTDVNSLSHGGPGGGYAWDLGVDWYESVKRATSGDNTLVVSASQLLDKIQINTSDVSAFKTVLGVAGGGVCVPAYLTSHPESMLSRQRRPRSSPQVNLYVCINSSAGVCADDLLKRGTAILALLEALRLQQVAVDLFLVSVLGAYNKSDNANYGVIEIPSRPLDLSTVGFAVAHPAFDRHLLHGLCSKFGYVGGWAADRSIGKVRQVLDMQPQDIYIPEVYGCEEKFENPQAWIDQHISQITGA